jgi:hypothetical protein
MASGHNEVTLFLPFVILLQVLLFIHQAKSEGLADMQPPEVEELINVHIKELTDEGLLRSPVRKT